jgi:hypothetical protein
MSAAKEIAIVERSEEPISQRQQGSGEQRVRDSIRVPVKCSVEKGAESNLSFVN